MDTNLIDVERVGINPHQAISKYVLLLFACCSFLSAALLFQVQLIVSKHILPWFGGSAAVWTTSMLIFQVLLLGGYLYAHLLASRFRRTAQTWLHLGLLVLATVAVIALSLRWPSAITPGAAWKPTNTSNPVLAVASIVLVSAGLPFFVLSTTGPLLQSWFARLGGGGSTYRLYSVSNLGSLLGLATYPFLVEPRLGTLRQGQLWSAAFCAFALCCASCAILARDRAVPEDVDNATQQPVTLDVPFASWLWFLLPACASALLLATTNLLCQEVATVPLLWVLPLSAYLLSFILCFDHTRWYKRAVIHPAFGVSLFVTCAVLITGNTFAELICLPILLFLGCMIFHGELVLLKPETQRLTAFYLAVSAGGAAGGLFVAVIAPQMFSSFIEFQLSLALGIVLTLVCLSIDKQSWLRRSSFALSPAITVGTILTAYAISSWLPDFSTTLSRVHFYAVVLLIGSIAGLGAFMLEKSDTGERRFRFVQIAVAALTIFVFAALYKTAQPKENLLLSRRNFYGMISVLRQPDSLELLHGQITHGMQLYPPMDRYPTTYYGPETGIGILMQNHPKRAAFARSLRVGVVGLGVGTLAAYGRSGDAIHYYEINPEILALANGAAPTFTYLRDSAAKVSVSLGDARLSLENEVATATVPYDILVLDAFSGDAIPVHLLTKQAFDSYWRRVDPASGIIAVHITSRHVNLIPVLQGLAKEFESDILIAYNLRQGPTFESCWVMLSRTPVRQIAPELAKVAVVPRIQTSPVLWTDDYSDLFQLIR